MTFAKKDAVTIGIIAVIAITIAIIFTGFLVWWFGWGQNPHPPNTNQITVEIPGKTEYSPFQDLTDHPYRTGFTILVLIFLALTVRKWYPKTWENTVINGSLLPVTGWIICTYCVILVSPWGEFARTHMFKPVPLVFQVALGYGVWMLNQNPKSKSLRHRLGVLLISFTLAMVVATTWKPWIRPYFSGNSSDKTVSAATTAKPIVTPEKDPCIEDDPQHGPDKEKTIKALANHPFLFALACRETRFNHADPENPTKVHTGKIDKDDTGIMQINKRIHKDLLKEKGLNADVFEDNIAFAKFLYDEKGIDHWFPLVSGRRYNPITVIVVASKDAWSPVVKIPRLTRGARYDTMKPVLAEIDGKEVIFDPEVDRHWGSVKQIRFKSIDGAKTTIRITFEFWPMP